MCVVNVCTNTVRSQAHEENYGYGWPVKAYDLKKKKKQLAFALFSPSFNTHHFITFYNIQKGKKEFVAEIWVSLEKQHKTI